VKSALSTGVALALLASNALAACPGVANCSAALSVIRADVARCEINDLRVMAPRFADHPVNGAQAASVCADGAFELNQIAPQGWAQPYRAALPNCIAALERRRTAFSAYAAGRSTIAHAAFRDASRADAACTDALAVAG
jgi:hypothetical protein